MSSNYIKYAYSTLQINNTLKHDYKEEQITRSPTTALFMVSKSDIICAWCTWWL